MNRKDRIVYKELNESSTIRSACWLLYKNRKESKIVICEYIFVVNSIDNIALLYYLWLYVNLTCS